MGDTLLTHTQPQTCALEQYLWRIFFPFSSLLSFYLFYVSFYVMCLDPIHFPICSHPPSALAPSPTKNFHLNISLTVTLCMICM